MELVSLAFIHRGKNFEADVAVPETLDEACTTMGEGEVYRLFKSAYLELQRKRIRSKRKKRLTLNLNEISDEQRGLLIRAGLLRDL